MGQEPPKRVTVTIVSGLTPRELIRRCDELLRGLVEKFNLKSEDVASARILEQDPKPKGTEEPNA